MSKLKVVVKKGPALKHPAKPTVIIPFAPTMPDVNLLPPRVFDAAQARKVRRKLIVIAGVLGVVIALGYAAQSAAILVANNALDAETAKSVIASKQVSALKPVEAFYAGVTEQKTVIQKTMAQELFFSNVATELEKSKGAGVKIQTMTVASTGGATAGTTTAGGAGSSCPAANPFTASTMVSCVQLTGTATARVGVSAFLKNLLNSNKFANPYIPVTDSTGAAGTAGVTFSGSVGITEKFFSKRYADDAYLLKGVGATK